MTEDTGRSQRWNRIWEIFDRALEVEEPDRAAFLADACGSDYELRQEVEKYLAAHSQGSSPLDRSPLESSLPTERFDVPVQPALARGFLVAGRFEIERTLGRGGMGQVYEARDRELDTPVALKTLRREIAPSIQARERFRREIQLAKQVTHPNVCRIYDLFRHEDDQLFLSMEFLEGETLAQRLADSGPLEPSEVLPIAEQIAAGLDAAHAVGVVHRDLKTGNVMLVPGSGSLRAVVTDFGLARTASSDPESAEPEAHRLTQTGQVLGTPAFMAPEQLEGRDVTPATDVYAFGVMLFEMVTGELPFSGNTPYSIVAKRLQSEAPSPRQFMPRLDRLWERVILRCLARRPEDRYQRAADVAAALRGEVQPRRASHGLRKKWAAGLAVVALTALLATFVVPRVFEPDHPAAAEALGFEERDWVLIASFDNRTGEAVLDGSVEAVLTRELANSSFMNVVPRARVGDALQLMRLPLDARVDNELAREVALRDGDIRAVLTGTIEKLGATYLLAVDVVDPAEGLVVASASEEAQDLDEVTAAVRRIASTVRGSLGEALSEIGRSNEQLNAVSTPSLRALQLYSQADRLFVEFGPGENERNQTAEQLLRDAVAEDPDFASGYTHLAWALLRQDAPVEEYLPISQKAIDLIDHAGPAERYFIRGSHLRFQGERSKAVEQYRALLELQPDHFWANSQVGFYLGSQGRSSEGTDYWVRAVATRPNDYGRVLGAAYLLVTRQGRLDQGQEWGERAWSLYEQLEAPPIGPPSPGWTRFLPAHQLWVRGDVDAALDELEQIVDSLPARAPALRRDMTTDAVLFYLDLGMMDRAAELQAMLSPFSREGWKSLMAWRSGDPAAARETLPLNDVSDPRAASYVALNLAQLGFAADAQRLLARLPERFEPPDVGAWTEWEGPVYRGNLTMARGTLAVLDGRFEEAIPLLEEGLPLLGSRNGLSDYFHGAMTLATTLESLDRPEQAIEVLQEASRSRERVLRRKHYWLMLRLRLAQTLRRSGRDVEATEVEEELGRYLAHADDDFPLLVELRLQQDLRDVEVERRN